MDDDISNHLDPELDAAVMDTTDSELPGPLTLPRIVLALHLLTAGAMVPLAARAVTDGNTTQFGVLAVMIVALVVSGVAIARITARRY